MADKELRKMKRSELIEIIYALQEDEENYREENEALRGQLHEKVLRMDEAGSIAEAALSLNHIFENAQYAAGQYLESISKAKEEADTRCDQIIRDAGREGGQIVAKARTDAQAILDGASMEADRIAAEAKEKAETMLTEARTEAEKMLDEARAGAERILFEARAEANGAYADAATGANADNTLADTDTRENDFLPNRRTGRQIWKVRTSEGARQYA
ncbi:MAG: hypothetical protein LUG99_20840 [Lachnospiraceae bacterium]|nr:hypothetical protein [Lachnospiraceae bacterium]